MAGVKEIKDRISSVQETQKITNAMYLISSTKLRKARRELDETQPYYDALRALVARLERHLPDIPSHYFEKPEDADPNRTAAFIVFTGDKGLAGAYNHNVLKLADDEIAKHKNFRLFVIGELGRQYFLSRGIQIDEHFAYTAQDPTLHRSRRIMAHMMHLYDEGEIGEVNLIYTEMVNSLSVQPVMQRVLPLVRSTPHVEIPIDVRQESFRFYPDTEAVIDAIVPNILNGYIYSALVEAFCSEQNARMLAMQSANRNAGELLRDLNIRYNRSRQAAITQEITEVCSGARALM